MSHRSRLAGFVIDCQGGNHDAAADFWSRALGLPPGETHVDGQARYTALTGTPAALHVEVQQVDHPSRVHLDIEADDIDAEAARLEALGATRIGFVKPWWVMQAPSGQRFCVVRMKHPGQGAEPNRWD